jgi:type I restriction enzyme R subunit
VLSNLGEATLLQLIVENGIEEATDKLPGSIKGSRSAMSETIENNMRKTIIQEMPVNTAYYEKMSVLLLELIRLRKEGAITYEELLKKYEELAKDIHPNTKKSYPKDIDTKPKQALYDNLEENEELSIFMDEQVQYGKDDDWRSTHIKRRNVEIIIRKVLEKYGISDDDIVDKIFEIVSNQKEY